MTTAYDMFESLKEIFSEKNHAATQTAMKALLTTKMVEGTSVRNHVLKMMSLLNELKILGAVYRHVIFSALKLISTYLPLPNLPPTYPLPYPLHISYPI